MTPSILALAREYLELRRADCDCTTAGATCPVCEPGAALFDALLSAADALASAVLALACDRHPEAAVRCEACVRSDAASRAARAGAGTPARAAASRANASKPRPGRRRRDAPRQRPRKKSLDT